MFLKYSARAVLLAGLTVSLLSGCTRSISDVDDTGKTTHPIFPDTASAIRKEGIVIPQDTLNLLTAGLTKPQIYELIGVPHFDEGVFGVKEWDYIIKVNQGGDLKTCQMKILFDKNMRAQNYYFLPEDCRRAAAVEHVSVKKQFNAESLFGFDSSLLSLSGVEQLSRFASELRREISPASRILVTGYTDRLGAPSYNDALSLERAEVIKEYLEGHGIGQHLIIAQGKGAREPLVDCANTQRDKLIACLAPNRRVVIEVIN